MKRGIPLVLALLAAFAPPVAPASAAAPPTAVYEVYRLRAASRTVAVATIRNTASTPAPLMWTYLSPRREGGFSAGGGEAMLPDPPGSYHRTVVDLSGGRRLFVAGPRGRTRIVVLDDGWGVREVRLGFRTVTSRQATASDLGGAGAVTSTAARVPSGRYGSVVVANTPCGENALGVWTFGTGTDATTDSRSLCGSDDVQWAYTLTAREWVSEGVVTGVTREEYRLAVLDFPKA